jgi:hypothetical protein
MLLGYVEALLVLQHGLLGCTDSTIQRLRQ